jgi:phospholipid/cholesterol/gamma-HCH transport system ATP-binding protein
MSAAIEIVGLHKSFGENHVLRGLDLRVEEGSTFVILGASGSGKSVLLKHMIGLLQPDAGKVIVFGKDLGALSPRELEEARRLFGMVFQSAALFDSLTVYENVAFPLRELRPTRSEKDIRRIVAEKLDLVGLSGSEELYPAELSGGMKKRVGLARAIARDPKIVLYDEPTTGLDPLTAESVNQMILDAQKKLGVTSVVISHDIASAFRIGDKIAVLHRGCIVDEGDAAHIQHSSNPYVQSFLLPSPART